jgi:glucose-6-phosphate 1-epimerase
MPAMPQFAHTAPHIVPVEFAGHAALQLRTRHGVAVLALHGAHLLSWVPTGQREVFWLSPLALPEPASIRGGVPVCWPWFATQRMPPGAMQHGPLRNLPWQVQAVHTCGDEEVSLTLQPSLEREPRLQEWAPGLQVALRVTLGFSVVQSLHTHNRGTQPFMLTQGLHSYFAVGQATHVRIEGLQGLRYQERNAPETAVQHTPFALDARHPVCDRIFDHLADAGAAGHRYTLVDPTWQRRIQIDTQGSQSVVVWNPGSAGARTMADVPGDAWQDFFCVEAANAGVDAVQLAPGAQHSLVQVVSVFS